MQNLKKKKSTNEQIKQKQDPKYREKTGGFQKGGEVRKWAKQMKVIKSYKLPIINKSQGCKVQQREYG